MLEAIKPLFKGDFVPIVFTCSNEFSPYLCLTLTSMVNHISSENNYEINILSPNLTKKTKEIINNIIGKCNNIKYRYLELNEYTDKYAKCFELLKRNKPNAPDSIIVIYYPIFFEKVFSEYTKMIFLDSDIIFHTDIAKLYEIDLEYHALAGVIDFSLLNAVNNNCTNNGICLKDYYKTLNIDISKYINSGVYIFNIKKWQEYNFLNKSIDVLQKKHLLYSDQDLLNIVFKEKIKFLSPEWNWQHSYEIPSIAFNKDIYDKYFANNYEPKIYHYCCKRVMHDQRSPLEISFWECARQTPFYEYFLYERLIKPNLQSISSQIISLPKKSKFRLFVGKNHRR